MAKWWPTLDRKTALAIGGLLFNFKLHWCPNFGCVKRVTSEKIQPLVYSKEPLMTIYNVHFIKTKDTSIKLTAKI